MDSGEAHQGASGGNSNLAQFRIFLASPGDVPLERKLAREAITHIGSERRFRNRIDLEIIAWDQPGAAVAMEAGLTPQDAIAQGLPKPEDCDLAVIILWSRIGTQLPSDFELKADGSPYLSGTEWEYLNALKGYRANRKPSVWVYRKKGAPKPDLDDPDYDAIRDQWNKVKKFFNAFTNPDGSLAGGINSFDTPDDFRQQFENHLRDRLDKLLESLPWVNSSHRPDASSIKPIWSHSPYPGLKAFTPEQSPIYFGRGREIDQLLQQFADPKVRFVAVVGVSGSGKSSLVKAGLLPRLRSGIIGQASWTDLLFTPGERGANPFLAMAYALNAALNLSGQTEIDIARALQAASVDGSTYSTADKFFYALLQAPESNAEVLLVVDQFEELFTQCQEDERQDFLALLEYIVTLPRIRMIATLRADFYERAIQESLLANLLRQDRSTFPLDPPAIGSLHQMIIRPAEAAGVELQDGLAQRLLDDAGSGPGAMALIAYTLNRLYDNQVKENEQSAHHITLDAYDKLGGVEGAVQQCAESALKVLPKPINLTVDLPILFSALVEVNEQEVATRRRATLKQLPENAKIIADRLVEARLLVSGKGEDNQPTLEVAHEIILSGWDQMRDWLRIHSAALRARRDLEQAASEWDKSGRQSSALRSGALLQRYITAAVPRSDRANLYLRACILRKKNFRLAYSWLSLIVIALLGILFHINKSEYGPSLATKALFVQLDLWPLNKPAMVKIPAGEFQMGDLSEIGNSNELPVHAVHLETSFEVGKFEVTFDEYDLFAAATGRKKPSDQGWGRGKLPVINVNWNDAVAYSQWLSKRTGLKYRLPSEAEWEYAARAQTRTVRYWLENADLKPNAACTYANVFNKKYESIIHNSYGGITWQSFNCEDPFVFTAPVGKFSPNNWKLHDTLGNVWEWVQDCWHENYDQAPVNGSAWQEENSGDCSRRVLRGGSWFGEPLDLRLAKRYWLDPALGHNDFGFRLARTL